MNEAEVRVNAMNRISAVLEGLSEEDRHTVIRAVTVVYRVYNNPGDNERTEQ